MNIDYTFKFYNACGAGGGRKECIKLKKYAISTISTVLNIAYKG